MEAYGLTRLPGTEIMPPAPAPEAAVREFHDEEYLAVLRAAGAGEPVPDAYRYGLGPGDNPIWPGVYEASVLACGGSILAADLVARGTSRARSRSRAVSTTRCRPARRASVT